MTARYGGQESSAITTEDGENAEAVADPAFGVAGAGALGSSEMTTGAAGLSGFGRGTFASVDAGLSAKAGPDSTAAIATAFAT